MPYECPSFLPESDQEQLKEVIESPDFSRVCKNAIQFFKDHPTKQKLRRADGDVEFPGEPNLNCSFLNMRVSEVSRTGEVTESCTEDRIYMVLHPFSEGQYGRIKFAYNLSSSDPRLFALKIQVPSTDGQVLRVLQEAKIGEARKLFTEKRMLRAPAGKEKVEKDYLLSPFLGITLCEWLAQKCPNDEMRIRAAVEVAGLIHDLHAGTYESSDDRTAPCVHKDIKLENLMIHPETGRIVLIDYGFASYDMQRTTYIGTRTMQPYDDQSSIGEQSKKIKRYFQRIGPQGVDVFALKRTLWMPYKTFKLADKTEENSPPSLFTEALFSRLPEALSTLIDTAVIDQACSRKDDTALEIAVQLIFVLLKIDASAVKLKAELKTRILSTYRTLRDASFEKMQEVVSILLSSGLDNWEDNQEPPCSPTPNPF